MSFPVNRSTRLRTVQSPGPKLPQGFGSRQRALPPGAFPGMFRLSRRRAIDRFMHGLLFACGMLSIAITIGIIAVLAMESVPFFDKVSLKEFLTGRQWTPLFSDAHFGILPLLCGTGLTSAVAMLTALPCGLIIAVYLSEFARPAVRGAVKPILEILAGVPTVVYGYFALLTVTPLLKHAIPGLAGSNALSAGLVMGIMILPLIASLSEDALYAVPSRIKGASYALGATRLQMVFRTLIPAAFSGITASCIVGVSRAVGETMIVAIAAGQQPTLTLDPRQAVETMTAYIVQVSLGDTPHGTLAYHTVFAVGMALFVATLALNMVSLALRERYRRAYQ